LAKKVKIVLVTSGGMNGRRLSYLFSKNNISYELLTVSFPLPKKRKINRISFIKKYIKGIFSNFRILRYLKMRNLPKYPIKAEFIGRLNSERMFENLKNKSPDYIFMMGGGILKDYIIDTANEGVLNAHPGILPYIRGVDAIKHSILKDIPIGVTGHFIDSGIDTGAIIERYWLPVESNNTLDEIVSKSNDLCVAVMVKFAFDIIDGKKLSTTPNNKKHALCKKISNEKNKIAHQKFKNNWHITHKKSLSKIKNLNSGLELLKQYEEWWKGIEKF
jgi:folate-dependent phosphoribosylglycinamide formyltransferase PurN